MKTIDARGVPCPKPLILTKTALTNAALNEEIEVLIDDDVAFHNITDFLKNNGITYTNEGKNFKIVKNKELSLNNSKEKSSGPVIAGRMQELLRSIFNYAIETGYAKNNPVDNLPKRKHEIKKSPLNKSLFNRLLRLIKKQESQNIRSAFLMLIYGFAPKSKIFSMQWKDLDFNHYTWNDFPLSDAAVVLLQDLPQNGRWVFPGRGRGHLTDPRIAWRKIVDAIGVSNLTMDDLYKYLMRQLTWTANKEDLRFNMNDLLNNLID